MKADDLDSVTDPSKLSESDFAPGTKWTPAGWTRSNPQYVAKSSKLELINYDDSNKSLSNTSSLEATSAERIGANLSGVINKSDIKRGNKILVSTVQLNTSMLGNQVDKNIDLYTVNKETYNKVYDQQGNYIGYISLEQQDHSEVDIYLNIDTDKNYATDPAFNNNMQFFIELNVNTDWTLLKGKKADDSHVYLITSNNIYKQNYIWSNHLRRDFISSGFQPGLIEWNTILAGVPTIDESTLTSNNSKFQNINRVFVLSGINLPTKITGFSSRPEFTLKGSDGHFYDDIVWSFPGRDHNIPFKQLANNLSVEDLQNETPENSATYSIQNNGSILMSYKLNTDALKYPKEVIANDIKKKYLYNIQDKDPDKVLSNTLNYYFNSTNPGVPMLTDIGFSGTGFDNKKPKIWKMDDVTPNITNRFSSAQGSLAPDNTSFNAELYRTTMVYYIDSKDNHTVSANSIIGTKNNATNYTVSIPNKYVLDTKSGKNIDGKQYKWSADKESIAYTFNEDQKLNDANPINIYVTHGTHNTNDNSGKSTRTIQYTGLPDNLKPKDDVQTVLFKRSGVTDDVTGKTTYGDWQPQAGNGHYTAVTSPTFAGYKPDQAVVPDTAATAGKDETVTVNYSRTDQNAKLTVHDDTTNTDLNDYAENSTGLYQDQISFKTAPSAVEQELKDQGYNIISDSFKGSPTYNADDSKNNFVIHVTHKIVPVTPDQPKTPTDVIPDTKQHYPTGVDTNDLNKDVQRSIFYKYEDNTQAEPTVVQKAHFGRTVKVDAVTQKIVDNGTWATKDNYPEVATKSIDGYTPDKTKVDSATPSMTTNQDQTVVYHANDEDAAITYIDDTTGKVLKTDTQKAKYKQTIKFATNPNTQIQTYKDQGYVLVSSDWKDDSTYQTDPARNKFTVHLKHGTSTVTPDNPKTPDDIIPGTKQHYPTGVDTNDLNQPQQRQITYTYADSKKQASPTVTQKATFHRTATVDNVTGKTTYTDWTTSDQYPEVKSPAIEGYTPDKSNVPVTKPVLNTKQDVAVVYNPNPEQVDVIAQDNTGKQLSKSTLHGNYNTDYSATTPVVKGYHLIKMPTNTHGTYKTHNDPIIYIYAPDSNSVPEQTDGTPKPDKSSYPNDLTPAKRSNKLPETGSINLQSEINSVTNNIIHTLSHLLH